VSSQTAFFMSSAPIRIEPSPALRRVLLIAFAYPPLQIVGSVRPAALAKYLPQFGWEAIVLTPKLQGTRPSSRSIIETGYRDVLEDWKARFHLDRKRGLHEEFGLPQAKKPGVTPVHTRALGLAKYVLAYPDSTKGWTPFALEAVREIRRQNLKIDAIVTTSPPISSHLIGREAKDILDCPWIADLRDLWTQNLGERTSNLLQIGLEKRTLGQADGLVTVSDPWASRLGQRYPEKKIWSITNGFDPDDFDSAPPPLTEEFSITYTGELYAGQRDPTLLFEVLGDLIKDGTIPASELRVRFYGRIEPWLPALVEKFGLNQVVTLNGPTPRMEAVSHQRESQILLLLPWSNPKETGHHSAKLFEYLAAARPILAIGGAPGVITETLDGADAGRHAISKAQVREFLLTAYADYKTKGYVPYFGKKQAVEEFGHPNMARRFAQALDSVIVAAKPRKPTRMISRK
jgi:glycosyltransferase involved in cell wall biosynthesis